MNCKGAMPHTIIAMTWIGWALLSALFAAATALLAKVGVAHVDSNLATAIRTTVVLVFAWAIALALGKHGEIRLIDRRTLLFLVLSGLATGLSWLCYFRALQLGPASRVAPLDKLSVPLVMLFAWLLLGEKLSVPTVARGLLITAGAVVVTWSSDFPQPTCRSCGPPRLRRKRVDLLSVHEGQHARRR